MTNNNRTINPFGSSTELTITSSTRIDMFTHTPVNPNPEFKAARKVMWNLIKAKQALGEWPVGSYGLLGSVGKFFVIQRSGDPEAFLVSIKYCINFAARNQGADQ